MILQAGSRSKGLRLGLRDLGGAFLVGARNVLPKVKAGNVRARPPSRVPYSPSSRRSRRTASRCRTRRAPQQAAIVRADREGSCAVVAGGGTFLDVTANFADGPVIEVHVERSSVATVAYRLQVSILTSNDDGAMSRTEAATRVIENDISTAGMASRMLDPPPILKHREGRPPRPVLIVHEVVEVEVYRRARSKGTTSQTMSNPSESETLGATSCAGSGCHPSAGRSEPEPSGPCSPLRLCCLERAGPPGRPGHGRGPRCSRFSPLRLTASALIAGSLHLPDIS